MEVTKENKGKIQEEFERITGIELNTWYFKSGERSLKIQYWLTGSNKIAIRFMQGGKQSDEFPYLPAFWSLSQIRYYTTFAGALKRIQNHYSDKFEGYETREQQAEIETNKG